jgi:hypothetical protein
VLADNKNGTSEEQNKTNRNNKGMGERKAVEEFSFCVKYKSHLVSKCAIRRQSSFGVLKMKQNQVGLAPRRIQ